MLEICIHIVLCVNHIT